MTDTKEFYSIANLTHEDALARVKTLAPIIGERAASAEKLRRQPDETVADIVQAGFLRLLLPKRWHGAELAFDTLVDTTIEISKYDASAGWCYSFLVSQPWLLSYFPEPAQKDVWEQNPDATLAAAVFPAGRFNRVQNGFQLSGNWPWISGIDHCQWIMLMAMPAEMDSPPLLFLIPKADIKVIDTWFVSGLKASGSKNAVAEQIFVPAHRAVPFPAILAGKTPGGVVNPGPNYQLPMIAAFPLGLLGPILGATMGAFEIWKNMSRDAVTSLTREQVATKTQQQILLSEIASQIDTAELLLRRCLNDIRQGGPIAIEVLVRLRRDYALISRTCVQVIEQIYLHSGGKINYESHPLQRYWRDIHAMTAHAALNFDTVSESYGRFQLNLQSNPNDTVRF
jgi:3-hydroxy-9,10-secoandrosta-1,3,5(10)-triene-9,17-dione monooxygenase